MSSGFLFHRPVAESSSAEIYEAVSDILAPADFIRTVGKDALHLTLLSDRMLINRKIPKRFVPYYDAYAASRRDFVSKDTLPWAQADAIGTGITGISDVLVIPTHRHEWLSRERNAAKKVAGISSDKLAFSKSDYSPHITIGKFIGSAQDWSGFYECERLLQEAGCGNGTVTLDPLRLNYRQHSWEFQPRQVNTQPLSDTESA